MNHFLRHIKANHDDFFALVTIERNNSIESVVEDVMRYGNNGIESSESDMGLGLGAFADCCFWFRASSHTGVAETRSFYMSTMAFMSPGLKSFVLCTLRPSF